MFLIKPSMVAFAVWAALVTPAIAFDCANNYCPKLSNCAEAYYKLEVCGHSERDADNDGIPCENVCGKDFEIAQKRKLAQWPKDLPLIATPMPGSVGDSFIPPAQAEPLVSPPEAEEFSCKTRKSTCKQMLSCDEATFYLKSCGAKSLDGNGDGVACNNLCR